MSVPAAGKDAEAGAGKCLYGSRRLEGSNGQAASPTHIGTLLPLVCPVSGFSCWVYAVHVSLGPRVAQLQAPGRATAWALRKARRDFSDRCLDTSTRRWPACAQTQRWEPAVKWQRTWPPKPLRLHPALRAHRPAQRDSEAAGTKDIAVDANGQRARALDRRTWFKEAYHKSPSLDWCGELGRCSDRAQLQAIAGNHLARARHLDQASAASL